ncbi:GNAT family N-acetyltransferase [Bacteroidota bacterium]
MQKDIIIRRGAREDLPQVFDLIMELAEYEKAPHEVENSIEQMTEDGFGEQPVFGFIVALLNKQIIGLSLYYYRYSTWKGKLLYLEDLIVTEKYRNNGIGKRLLDETVKEALKLNCTGLQWQVLDWNKSAIEFYRKLGASFDGEWVNCRLSREQLLNYNFSS